MAGDDGDSKSYIWYFIFALWLMLAINYFWTRQDVEQIPYSKFQQNLAEKKIDNLVVDNQVIYGDYVTPVDGKKRFVTPRVAEDIATDLSKYGVHYTGVFRSPLVQAILSWVVPALAFFAIWYFLMPRFTEKGGGFMAIGANKAKVYVNKDTGVTFADVAGVDEAKEELEEIIDFLKSPEKYSRLGGRIPKGVLLVGPPGTGKTLLAKAVAGEAKVPFYSISGSEFIEMFVGVGAARVRDLFEQARNNAPAIIFIDELDALGRARGAFPAFGGHDEREQTLNQLLAEMDGFDTSEGVVILAATNRPEILDPALLRAGRFDRQVLVDRPDMKGRVQILQVHTRKVKLSPDVDLGKVAAITTGFSGADLANLVNEATLEATRRKANAVGMEDFTYAVERLVAGLEKKTRILTPFERRVVAYHEMGHALASIALPGVDVVHKVSIIPRGIGSLGYTIQRPTEDRYLMTEEELQNKITVLLGGRAAEKLVFGLSSTGAADDLVKATDIAHSMVARFGMDESLGYVAYEEPRTTFLDPELRLTDKKYSEATAMKIDTTVRNIIAGCFDRATTILKNNRDILEACVVELLKTERIEEEKLRVLTRTVKRAKKPEASENLKKEF
ncbi:MAG: ATP-dependent zinc metalloprotease FtsH [Alphaproteobacteria bacterium]|nr:ATP-dependent zinc metalloprotease FtsH [Alphaproteobacteria bacterium]